MDVKFELGVATKKTPFPQRLRQETDPITALYCLYNKSEPSTPYQEQIRQAMQKEPSRTGSYQRALPRVERPASAEQKADEGAKPGAERTPGPENGKLRITLIDPSAVDDQLKAMTQTRPMDQENTSQKENSVSSTTDAGEAVQLTEQVKHEFSAYTTDYEWEHLRRLLKLDPLSYQQVYQEF